MKENICVVDTHQHFWELGQDAYTWITPESGVLNQSFTVSDVEDRAERAGVDEVVLVQADATIADTDAMIRVADQWSKVAGIVGWVALDQPDQIDPTLERYRADARIVGIRHLMHTEADPDWTVRDDVMRSLATLEKIGYTYDVVATLPRHLEHVPTLARRFESMPIILDHLATPPIADGGREPWAGLLAEAAKYPNVSAKVSGLGTLTAPDACTADAMRPYLDHALEQFGADRLMFGTDWPVSELAGGYEHWWSLVTELVAPLSYDEQAAILGGTGAKVYRLRARG